MRSILALVSLLVALSACGQRGPLYFRDSPPPGVKPERPAPVKPVPYPIQPDEPGRTKD